MLGHQIPRDGRELHGVDAEDVERAAAHRLDEMGDGVVQQPLHLHEEQDEAEAADGVQKNAEGPQHPLAEGNAVRFARDDDADADDDRRAQNARNGKGLEALFKQLLLFGPEAHIQVRHDDHALRDAERRFPHKGDAPA